MQKRLERKTFVAGVHDLERCGDRCRTNFDSVGEAAIVLRILPPRSSSGALDIFQFHPVGDTSILRIVIGRGFVRLPEVRSEKSVLWHAFIGLPELWKDEGNASSNCL